MGARTRANNSGQSSQVKTAPLTMVMLAKHDEELDKALKETESALKATESSSKCA